MANKPEERAGAAFEDGLEIKVSNDKMRVTIDLDVQNIQKWSESRIVQELAQEGILYGVDKPKITQLFEESLFNQPVEVATGSRAEDGKDGYVKYHIDVTRTRGKPKELDDGSVDLKDLGVYTVIAKDTLLAELMPPTEGKSGKDVYGMFIEAKPGKEGKLSGGKGTRLVDDGKRLMADTDGILSGTPEKLEVDPALIVQGNVSYETGNIDSNVSVAISGNVLSGFVVKSQEDICVTGVVEAATLESEKNITISAGIQGDNRAVLKAGGVITAMFANEATLVAREGIHIDGALTHCYLETSGSVEAAGDKGVIVGGEVHAGTEIAAHVIGSELGAKTRIEVGPDILAMAQQSKELHDKRDLLEKNLAKIQQVLMLLQAARKSGQKLPVAKMKMAQQAISAHSVMTKQLQTIQKEDEELADRVSKERDIKRYIRIRNVLWPGTSIRILNAQLVPKQPIQAATLTLVDKEIQSFGYREKEEKSGKKKKEA